MSFLNHIEEQKKIGNLSNKDALDMKMNYLTLSDKEKNEFDAKYSSEKSKNDMLESTQIEKESINQEKKIIKTEKGLTYNQKNESKKSSFLKKQFSNYNEYISGKTFLKRILLGYVIFLLFPIWLYYTVITTYKRCQSLEWNKAPSYLTSILMIVYLILTPLMVMWVIIFFQTLSIPSDLFETTPIWVYFVRVTYLIITLTVIFKLVFKNGNKYFKQKDKQFFLENINNISNDILLDLILNNHLTYDELIDFKLFEEKKEYLNKKLNSNIDYVISEEND